MLEDGTSAIKLGPQAQWPPVEPINRTERATPQIIKLLRNAILNLSLLPSQSISENDMADVLGTSRTPIREAFQRLMEEGLLVGFPQVGTFVAPISRTALLDAQYLRESVEAATVRTAAELCDAERARRLNELLDRHEEASRIGDLDLFHALDEQTHLEICAQTGHPGIWAILAQARGHLDRARRLDVPDARNSFRVLVQHKRIIGAITARDPNGAEAALREHLRTMINRLPVLEAMYPQHFTLNIGGDSQRSRRKA
jgi:GntR family transcriptional regulator, rspAB operon transcriptional repressor